MILALIAIAAVAALILAGPDIGRVFGRASTRLDEPSPAKSDVIVVTVLDAEKIGIKNMRVYAYDDQGRYRGQSGLTGANGQLTFDLPNGRYQFRARFQSQNYWSDEITWPREWRAPNDTGQQPFTINVLDNDSQGIPDLIIQAFTAKGFYVNLGGHTDENGQISFNLAEGNYKFRAYDQGNWFWSDPVNTSRKNETTIDISRQAFVVAVVDAAAQGIANVPVYAFTGDTRYFGLHGRTDSNGQLRFELADGSYQFRADYQGQLFWSEPAGSATDGLVKINTGQRPFTVNVVDAAGRGIADVRIYAITDQGRYADVTGLTDAAGQAALHLSDGTYQFRADYQGRQFWSDMVNSPAVTSAVVETRQQSFTVRVTDAAGQGIGDVRVYAFTGSRRFAGLNGTTGVEGVVSFEL
ncbi:MAG: hypothetical protein ACE5FD_07585, partial [Anaerolineae bacterium]